MSDTLSTENQDELGNTLGNTDDPSLWVSHPIHVRLTLPFFAARYYFTVVAGRENRCPARLTDERAAYPLMTVGNAMFGLGITTVFALMAVALWILRSSIIEFCGAA